MLQNAYFLAKIGADTAENERNLSESLPIGRCKRSDVDLRGWLQGTPPTCGVLECTYVGKHPPDHAVEVSKIIEFCKKKCKILQFWRARSRLYRIAER